MKKIFLVFFLSMLTVCGYSQTVLGYKCTGTHVNIRKGPGKNYAVEDLSGGVHCDMGKAQLDKGEIVWSKGEMRNGFVHVYEADYHGCLGEGWVSSQYLKSAIKCTACNGSGFTGRKCPECGGAGIFFCCYYTGKELCPYCYGLGFK